MNFADRLTAALVLRCTAEGLTGKPSTADSSCADSANGRVDPNSTCR